MAYNKLVLNALRKLNEEFSDDKKQIEEAWKEISPIIYDGIDDSRKMLVDFVYEENSADNPYERQEIAETIDAIDTEIDKLKRTLSSTKPKDFVEMMGPVDDLVWYHLDSVLVGDDEAYARNPSALKELLEPISKMVTAIFKVLNDYGVKADINDVKFDTSLSDFIFGDYIANLV